MRSASRLLTSEQGTIKQLISDGGSSRTTSAQRGRQSGRKSKAKGTTGRASLLWRRQGPRQNAAQWRTRAQNGPAYGQECRKWKRPNVITTRQAAWVAGHLGPAPEETDWGVRRNSRRTAFGELCTLTAPDRH
ncbi:unnamed protein product, partial [Boreogadus saida]